MRIKRTMPDVRLEMTPLIDVVFLLLTFFIFSLVLMVRAEVMDVTLPGLRAGAAAEGAPLVTLSVDSAGAIFVDGERVEPDALVAAVQDAREAEPSSKILIAGDVGADFGVVVDLIDRLKSAGVSGFSIVGTKGQSAPSTPNSTDTPSTTE